MGADRLRAEGRKGLSCGLKDGAFLQRLGRIVGIGREQGAGAGQFARQHGQPFGLVQGGVVGADARDLQQVGDHALMHVRVLAQVQRRHVEAEHVRRRDQPRQPVVGEDGAVGPHQTVVQDVQIGAEGVGTVIGRGFEAGGARRRLAGQGRIGGRQPGVDLAERPTIWLVRALDGGVARALRQGGQFGRDAGQVDGQAELGAQGVHLVQIEAQRGAGLAAEGGAQGRGVDIGIAVAVAADP